MNTVWLIVANCGDYYCEGTHVLAVATSETDAERLKSEAENATWTNRYGSSGKRWSGLSIEPVGLGSLLPDARSVVYR